MDKVRYAKYVAKQRELNKDKVCEYCGHEHNHTYGTGRFCSESCYKSYIASKNKGSEKCKAHLNKLKDSGLIRQPAPYGTWKCPICQTIFDTRKLLEEHLKNQHTKEEKQKIIVRHIQKHKNHRINKKKPVQITSKLSFAIINLGDNQYKCPLCEYIGNKHQVIGHLRSCKKHPDKKRHDEAYKKGGKTYKKRLLNGEIKRSGFVKGSHHTPEIKEKLRNAALKYRESCIGKFHASYNKHSIPILEEIGREHGWHLQHAENGGEVRMFGYFLDAYDKENNVVVEYDEKEHYIDVENNILIPKDIERQNYIIEKLHCDFYRYNEYTKTLYKINN